MVPGAPVQAQRKYGLLGFSDTAGVQAGGGLARGWESDWSVPVPDGGSMSLEGQEGRHWPSPLVKVDGDSGSSCGQVEPRSCFGRTDQFPPGSS